MIPSNLISVPLLHDSINDNKPFIIHELGLVPGDFVIKSADNTEHIGNVEYADAVRLDIALQDGSMVVLMNSQITTA